MSVTEIRKVFEQRRFNLIKTLENGRDEIELSKQHQMYGAILELDNILKTIDYYRDIETEKHFDFRLRNEPDTTVLEKISLKLKGINPVSKILLNK